MCTALAAGKNEAEVRKKLGMDPLGMADDTGYTGPQTITQTNRDGSKTITELGGDGSVPKGATGSIGDPLVAQAMASARNRNRSRQGFRSTLSGGGSPMDNSGAVERLDVNRTSEMPVDPKRRRNKGPQAPRRSLLG